MKTRAYLTTSDVSQELAVAPDKVGDWIRNGATNCR